MNEKEIYLSGVVKTNQSPEEWLSEFKRWLKSRNEKFDGEIIDIGAKSYIDDDLKEFDEILKELDEIDFEEVLEDEIG